MREGKKKNKVDSRDSRRTNVFTTASPTLYTSLIVRPRVPRHNGSLLFSSPWNGCPLFSPFMNPPGLPLLSSPACPNGLALRCHQCYLRPFQGRHCYSILDRGLQRHGSPLAASEGLVHPAFPHRDQGCKSLRFREFVHSCSPSPTNYYPQGRGAVDDRFGKRSVQTPVRPLYSPNLTLG